MTHEWELGTPLVYEPAVTPLSVATEWPADMDPRSAKAFVTRLERDGATKIGAQSCGMGHESWWLIGGSCAWCRAAV